MPTLFGKNINKEKLIEFVGDISQICGIDSFVYDNGMSKGVHCLEFRNASGLRFLVLPDRGMDIFYAEYKGIPLNWKSGAGVVSPYYYSSQGWDWLRNFYGGLLITCGLSNVGDYCKDQGAYLKEENFGAHGRISNLPAKNVSYKTYWDNDNYILKAEGEVIEASGQGENFRLSRTIKTEIDKTTIEIHDSVENRSFYTIPHMFLYHINIGYPLLDDKSEIFTAFSHIQGLDSNSEEHRESIGNLRLPDKDSPELVFIINQKKDQNGFCNIIFVNRMINNNSGLAIYLKYQKKDFPYLNLWKRLNRGEYVVGFEPGNCTVQGRINQRKRGDLRYLKPQEVVNYNLEIGILTSNEEIDDFISNYRLTAL